MGRGWFGWCMGVALVGAMGLTGGCAWYDEMNDRQDLRGAATGMGGTSGTTTYVRQDSGVDQLRQELATMRVDMNTLQDNQRRTLAQVGELQEGITARDAQVEELRGLLAVLESRLKASDAEWQGRMDNLRESMGAQNKKSLDAMAQRMAEEMAKQAQQNNQSAVVGEHVVRQGDVLSVIATAYGVSLKDLMDANGLRNDQIRIGQRLKIPAPRR